MRPPGQRAPGGASTSGTTYDDGYNPLVRFDTAGILAMSKTGNDLNDAQFFVTTGPMANDDFRDTAVAFMTSSSTFEPTVDARWQRRHGEDHVGQHR